MNGWHAFWKSHRLLLTLLAASFALRATLVFRGGEYFFDDECRYHRSWKLLDRLAKRDFAGGLDSLIEWADHTGFVVVGMPLAAVQYAAIRAMGMPAEEASVRATPWVPALLLAAASVACIGLVYAVARRAGAEKGEATVAAFLMAGANTMFYYARLQVPYDTSMAILLAALWIGLGPRKAWGQWALCGFVVSIGFLTYNGYWLLAMAVLGLAVFYDARSFPELLGRAIVAGMGFVAVPALLTVASLARGLEPYVLAMARFSRFAATQCDFAEGWSMPWVYLWHVEHGLLLVWIAAASLVIYGAVVGWRPARGRGLAWLAAAAAIYGAMVLCSVGLERIGVFGRQVRQLVPFFCLATACMIATFSAHGRWNKMTAWAGGLLLAAQACANFATPLTLRFPLDVLRQVQARYGPVARDSTIVGALVREGDCGDPTSRYLLLNAQFFCPVRSVKAIPPGRLLLRVPHPVAWLPYQYEGYLPAERHILRSTDFSMLLLDTQDSSP